MASAQEINPDTNADDVYIRHAREFLLSNPLPYDQRMAKRVMYYFGGNFAKYIGRELDSKNGESLGLLGGKLTDYNKEDVRNNVMNIVLQSAILKRFLSEMGGSYSQSIKPYNSDDSDDGITASNQPIANQFLAKFFAEVFLPRYFASKNIDVEESLFSAADRRFWEQDFGKVLTTVESSGGGKVFLKEYDIDRRTYFTNPSISFLNNVIRFYQKHISFIKKDDAGRPFAVGWAGLVHRKLSDLRTNFRMTFLEKSLGDINENIKIDNIEIESLSLKQDLRTSDAFTRQISEKYFGGKEKSLARRIAVYVITNPEVKEEKLKKYVNRIKNGTPIESSTLEVMASDILKEYLGTKQADNTPAPQTNEQSTSQASKPLIGETALEAVLRRRHELSSTGGKVSALDEVKRRKEELKTIGGKYGR